MDSINWLQVLGGFGLFLFSLRYLNRILESSLSRKLKPLLNNYLEKNWQCLFAGFGATMVVQASSISIITAMGLIGSTLITFEQGFFIMLGATLGTTMKSWIFAINVYYFGLTLLGLSSIIFIFVKRNVFKNILEIFTTIGLAFLGFNMMVDGLVFLSEVPQFVNLLKFLDGSDFRNQLTGVILGMILTIALQSSSTLTLIVLGLASEGIIPFAAGAAIILGANIGTTSTALFVSLEHETKVKRLAVAHFFVKVSGVAFTLFFFPYFLMVVDYLVPGTPLNSLSYHLAGVHTMFNLINVIWWSLFSSLMFKFLYWLMPQNMKTDTKILSKRVRKMLASNPDLAFKEIDNQIKKAEKQTKEVTDLCFEILTNNLSLVEIKQRLTIPTFIREFEDIKSATMELLMRVNHPDLEAESLAFIKSRLKFLAECNEFYEHTLSFLEHLETGIMVDYYQIPKELAENFQNVQKALNELWLVVLLKRRYQGYKNVKVSLHDIENYYFYNLVNTSKNSKHTYLSWIYECLNFLNQLAEHMKNLCQASAVDKFTQKLNLPDKKK